MCAHMAAFYLCFRFPIILCCSPHHCRAQLRFRMVELDFLGFTGNEKQHSHSSYSVISQSALLCSWWNVGFFQYGIGPFVSSFNYGKNARLTLETCMAEFLHIFPIQHIPHSALDFQCRLRSHPPDCRVSSKVSDGKLIDDKMNGLAFTLVWLG